jgi:hypothetical protein
MKIGAILFAILFHFSSNPLQAQLSIVHRDLGINEVVGQINKNNLGLAEISNISGSQYLNENFENSDIFYDREFKISKVPVRYNIYNDQFEFKNNNTILNFANPEKIDSIVTGAEIFIYVRKNKYNKVQGFAKVWNEQYPSVLTKMKVEFFNKEKPQAFAEAKPDRFERSMDRHYLIKSKDEIEIIKSVKKLIISLEKHTSELSDFAKKEKISSGDPEELAKLLDYYNGLD